MKSSVLGSPRGHRPPVVVGIDGSQAAIQAAEWAVDEAVDREVPLRLVYVIPRQAEPAPFASVGNERMEQEYGETALRIAAAAVAAVGKNAKVETAILHGDPVTGLVEESCNSAMLCVGSTGIGRVAKLVVGSTAAEVAQAAPCSVAIIRSQSTRHTKGKSLIAVAVMDCTGNDVVVEQAMLEAQLRHAPLLALGVWRRDLAEMTAEEMARRMQLWVNRYPNIELHTARTHCDIADFLAVSDRRIQLTVLGDSDVNQIARLVGPHRHPVLGNAECSVLIVRPSSC
ncbi:universal stress protein [Mycobacterium sp.]|uniref:universal stress protein n=1 Tax=Mycobacterium sp. TaxID=1785 RepID=UPI0025F3F86F|nr:universal stress protein [Mycobacterium sp.]